MVNPKKVQALMLDLGHRDNLLGTQYLQIGMALYKRGMSMTKELYPGIAKVVDSTPSRVERAMRHSIETAWDRCDIDTQLRHFGNSVSPAKGKPTVGEWVARVASICED